MYTTILPFEGSEDDVQIKTGHDYCETYKVGEKVLNGESDGVYEGLGKPAGPRFEKWRVVIRDGVVLECSRKIPK